MDEKKREMRKVKSVEFRMRIEDNTEDMGFLFKKLLYVHYSILYSLHFIFQTYIYFSITHL